MIPYKDLVALLFQMGYDLIAYFYDVNQDEIEAFITSNNIDREDWDQHPVIESYFKEKFVKDDVKVNYEWDRECGIHTFYSMYGTSFIRDDTRLTNRVYQRVLEGKLGRPFPECLRSVNWTLRSAKDAMEVSQGIRLFFSEDNPLMKFADWLEKTAKYCSIYELSR